MLKISKAESYEKHWNQYDVLILLVSLHDFIEILRKLYKEAVAFPL